MPFRLMVILTLLLSTGIPAVAPPQPGWNAPGRPAVYEFGAGFCYSCKEMEKVMAELQNSLGDNVEFRMVYLDKEKQLFQQYQIMLIPTQVFLNAAGTEVDRHVGPLTKDQVLAKLKELKFIPD